MADPTGFLRHTRKKHPYRPVEERLGDWRQVMSRFEGKVINQQASRCMDCGIPFCHQGCPLGNLIPEWNDLVREDQWELALDRLHATNNFPEFTGTLCPAPCEGSCVLGINDSAVSIKSIELEIIDRGFEQGWIKPQPPELESGDKVAIIGSGPAGLAGAQQLRRAGHQVTVYEREDRPGGLLRYGIPEFKMEKKILDRRLSQLTDEGVVFLTNMNVGIDVSIADIQHNYDAILLSGGSTVSRDLNVPGRNSKGVYLAMDYLSQQNRLCEGDDKPEDFLSAYDKDVIIIGGGDTGSDCLGTAHRQGARSVTNLEILEKPPKEREETNPWPEWPNIYRVASAHEEGGVRKYSVSTKSFITDENNQLSALEVVDVEINKKNGEIRFQEIEGSLRKLPCQLALLALGFSGPEKPGPINELGLELTPMNNVKTKKDWMTSVKGVFAAGDIRRGQSLIVWAIAEGRSAASSIDRFLKGKGNLPSPLEN
ncbi:MAG: glutamate synthase subunit beta [Pseudomonadota bacterium]|nr:glutamate synthase subunit beta [Pseudomonadota bacterium]